MSQGYICIFHFGFFVVAGFVKGDNLICHFIIIILVEKAILHALASERHRAFWECKCMWRLPAVKIMLSACHFVLHCVLFLYMWHISSKKSQFITGDLLFFFSSSFFSPNSKKLNLSLIFVRVSESILSILIFDFSPFLFC